jgi:hypothetical protein
MTQVRIASAGRTIAGCGDYSSARFFSAARQGEEMGPHRTRIRAAPPEQEAPSRSEAQARAGRPLQEHPEAARAPRLERAANRTRLAAPAARAQAEHPAVRPEQAGQQGPEGASRNRGLAAHAPSAARQSSAHSIRKCHPAEAPSACPSTAW